MLYSTQEEKKALQQRMQEEIKAPYISVQNAALGGLEICLVVAMEKQEDWANKIFENSKYFRLWIRPEGTIEQFSISHHYRKAKLRKQGAKDVNELLTKIQNYIDKISTI